MAVVPKGAALAVQTASRGNRGNATGDRIWVTALQFISGRVIAVDDVAGAQREQLSTIDPVRAILGWAQRRDLQSRLGLRVEGGANRGAMETGAFCSRDPR